MWRKVVTMHTPELEFEIKKEQDSERLSQAKYRLAQGKFMSWNWMCRQYTVLGLVVENIQPIYQWRCRVDSYSPWAGSRSRTAPGRDTAHTDLTVTP